MFAALFVVCSFLRAFSWKAESYFYGTLSWVFYENTVRCWRQEAAAVFPSDVAEFYWNVECAQARWMRCVVTLGAILPRQLKCSMLSCVSLHVSSSTFPLTENLSISIICLPPALIPLGLASFFLVLLCLEAFAQSLMIIPVWSL